jgi:hypothetical protein
MKQPPLHKAGEIAIKKINAIYELADKVRNTEEKVWPFTFDHDIAEKDCFKRPDGLWEAKQPHYNKDRFVFIWRNHPDVYCTAGRPCRTSDKVQELYEGSETEKLIHEQDGLQFFWTWKKFRNPTETHWGHKPTDHHVEVRKDGKVLFAGSPLRSKGAKKELIEWVYEYAGYSKPEKKAAPIVTKDLLKVIAYIRVYGMDLYGTKHTNIDTGKGNLESYFCGKLNWSQSKVSRLARVLIGADILTKQPAEAGMKFYSLSSPDILRIQLKYLVN